MAFRKRIYISEKQKAASRAPADRPDRLNRKSNTFDAPKLFRHLTRQQYSKYESDVIFIYVSRMSQSSLQTQPPIQDVDFRFSNELMRSVTGCRKGERTKAAIQSALCQCLEKSSPVDLTVAEICDEAGLALGTFYIYFSDRNALIGDVALRFIAFMQREMLLASRQQKVDPVRAATATYFLLFENNIGLMKCLLSHLDRIPEAQAAFQALNRDWLESAVVATKRQWAQKGRLVDNDELMRRAYALGGMTDQYLSGLLLSDDPNMQAISKDRNVVIDTLTLLWKRGMEP